MVTPTQIAGRKSARRQPRRIAHPKMPHTCVNGPVIAAMVFPDARGARAALGRARAHMRTHALCVEETLVVTRHADGRLAPWPVRGFFWAGLVGGAIWGGFLGGLFFQPVIGALAGLSSGGLAGWLAMPRPEPQALRRVAGLARGETAVLLAARHRFDDDTLVLVRGADGRVLEDEALPAAEGA